MKLQKASTFAAILLLGLPLQTGEAAASHVACGAVITQNTTLDADVGPCPGDGIVIGASGITLDLAGFRVLGTRLGAFVGVRVDGPHHGVRITNGSITGFERGVDVQSSDNIIDRLTVTGTAIAMHLQVNHNNQVRRNILVGNYSGIETRVSSDNTIESNLISRTVTEAIFIGGSVILNDVAVAVSGNRLVGNWISNNGDGVFFGGSGEIRSNTIRNNRGNGVSLRIVNLNFGQCCVLVQGNNIERNTAEGILVQGSNNRILSNIAFANGRFDLFDANSSCDANIWTENQFGTRNQPCIN